MCDCLGPLTITIIINSIKDLDHIMAATNMSCLTPDAALSGDCGFLSANMYARSLFGKFSYFFWGGSLLLFLVYCFLMRVFVLCSF